MAIEQVSSGNAPILWSTIEQAFKIVNNNFTEIALTIGGGGGLVDLTALNTSLAPDESMTYDVGEPAKRWRDLYLEQFIYLGNAIIKSENTTINLPSGSTIGNGGQLLDEIYFKTIAVAGEDSIVSESGSNTLTMSFGSGIDITTNSSTNTVAFSNTGVISAIAGAGIAISASTGNITFSNNGVRSITNSSSIGSRTPGLGIHTSSSTGTPILTNTGVLEIQAGSGTLAVSTNATTGIVTITNTAPAQNAFQQIEVNGDGANRLIADSTTGIFRIVSGQGITLAKTVATDTLTMTINPVFDLRGSVFADDSTLLVDAVSGIIPAAVVTGTFTGNVIGNTAGIHDGDVTGSVFADNSTMLVDGVGGQIVGPINSFDGGNSISMDPINGVVIGGTAGAQIIGAAGALVYIGGGTSGGTSGNILLGNGTNRVLFVSNVIDTDDSSALIFEPPVTFNTDVTFENDINVTQRLRVQGSRVINLTELQSVVAASSSFADFQVRIAALV
jgi:hypothetical protein